MDSTFDASAPVDDERGSRRRLGRIRPGRRLVVGAVAGVLTFSLVYGLAASLNLTSDSLGAATTTVAACQATALNATYLAFGTRAGYGAQSGRAGDARERWNRR